MEAGSTSTTFCIQILTCKTVLVGIFNSRGKGSKVMAMQSKGTRTSTSRATMSAAHMVADHGGYGNRQRVRRSRRGIDKGDLRENHEGLEVMSRITEVCVGMVEGITQINAGHKPTSTPSAGAFSRLSSLRRAYTMNQGQNSRKVLRLHG